ncbi:MAG TPA: polysaccharide biosynthesis tyrosine autokinase [Gammaproteobacteria bacterium]|nr:polysaccharide biosynthesis tyrosine autokinase [Gammaproteobacteria bacterium]
MEYLNDAEAERDDDDIDLREVLGLLIDEWRWVAAITAGILFLAVCYAFLAAPVYETNALVQIESEDKGLGDLSELSTMLTGETPTDAEIEIMRSRLVLGQAIDQQGLNIEIEPDYFPLIGGAIARRYDGEGVAPARLGLDHYAWGGEHLKVDRLDVGRELDDETLSLVTGEGGAYTLLGPDGDELLHGQVGKPAEGHGVSMFVSDIRARPGTEFGVVHHDTLTTLKDLGDRLSVNERGKQTGIVELDLDGHDSRQIAATLNAVTNLYVQQNVERKSEEAAKSLAFLNTQLPKLRDEANRAQAALSDYRAKKGTVDLDKEAQGLLDQLTQLEQQNSELQLKGAEDAQLFTSQHPTMLAIKQQKSDLEQKRESIEHQIRLLPKAEQGTVRLMRDAKVSSELYTTLLDQAQQLRVMQAGTIGNVRVIDSAFVPIKPVKPKKALVLALGVVLGGMLGVFAVFVRHGLDSGISDPKVLEQHFGLPVYAIVPRSEAEAARSRAGKDGGAALLAVHDPQDPAVESLRSLRTSMEFLFHESPSRIVTIGGPAPALGKSFVSANLGVLLAQVDRRVLVVDADLRRGHLHRNFALKRGPGLSELITGEQKLQDVVKPSGLENLFVLPSGRLPPNPAELLVSRRFEELLARLGEQYDIVLLDAPPVLAASEAANLAKLAGINFFVVRSGWQNRREVELAVDRLAQAGARPKGFIFNDMAVGSRRYAYAGYRYYRYEKGGD